MKAMIIITPSLASDIRGNRDLTDILSRNNCAIEILNI